MMKLSAMGMGLALALAPIAVGAAPIAIGTGDFSGAETVVSYDAEPFGSVDGNSYGGVAHGFTVGGSASADARVSPPPGVFSGLSGRLIEGLATGVLSLDFGSAQNRFGFNWATSVQSAGPGGTVRLFDASNNLLGSVDFTGALGPVFREGFAGVFSDVAFQRAEIAFASPLAGARFAFDNVRFESTADVPEPATLLLLGIAAAATGLRRRR